MQILKPRQDETSSELRYLLNSASDDTTSDDSIVIPQAIYDFSLGYYMGNDTFENHERSYRNSIFSMRGNEVQEILAIKEFSEKFLKDLKDIEPEYSKIVSEDFWELLYE